MSVGAWQARLSALGYEDSTGRGDRLMQRVSGLTLRKVTCLAAVPNWLTWPVARRRQLAATVALLHCRTALDRELRAEVVAPLAALTGEAVFDAICAMPVISETSALVPLPTPAHLTKLGEHLLEKATPLIIGGGGDAYAARLAASGVDVLAEAS